MKCPVCKDPDLIMADRQNIEIDYCPQCRGVWLDRGELDKIIERSVGAAEPAPAPAPAPPQPVRPNMADQRQSYPDYQRGKDHYQQGGYHHKKRKSFLGDLFDFD
jgi:Zn-finger nucleic acid-binding protein